MAPWGALPEVTLAKLRVYELARELGLDSKDVLARVHELGIEAKTASSGLDEDSLALVRMSYDEATTAEGTLARD